jgi:hypothetical protein
MEHVVAEPLFGEEQVLAVAGKRFGNVRCVRRRSRQSLRRAGAVRPLPEDAPIALDVD